VKQVEQKVRKGINEKKPYYGKKRGVGTGRTKPFSQTPAFGGFLENLGGQKTIRVEKKKGVLLPIKKKRRQELASERVGGGPDHIRGSLQRSGNTLKRLNRREKKKVTRTREGSVTHTKKLVPGAGGGKPLSTKVRGGHKVMRKEAKGEKTHSSRWWGSLLKYFRLGKKEMFDTAKEYKR